MVVGQIRRKLAVASVRAQCLSLLGRLQVIGGSGQAEAGRRRAAALESAFTMARDRAAFMEAIRTGHHRVRRGFGKVTLMHRAAPNIHSSHK